MPDTDPASPAIIKERRSRIRHGMTPFLDSLITGNCFIGSYHWITTLTGTEKHGTLSGC